MPLPRLLPHRPLPYLDDLNREFWTGGADGRLHVQRCGTCGTWLHPPLPRCRSCGGHDLAYEPTSGSGTVHSYTVNHQQWIPGADAYAIVLVELDEQVGLRITSNLRDCDFEAIYIGMPVRVAFEQHGDVWLPQFVPDGGTAA